MKVGQPFIGWDIKEKIGKGGFGEVYLAIKDGFKSAIKHMKIPNDETYKNCISSGMTENEILDYFKPYVEFMSNEIKIMMNLTGVQGIVIYYDHLIRELDERPGWEIFIRMEYLTPLNTYIANNGLTLKQILNLGVSLNYALEECKKENIIHRDIKEGNILVDSRGFFKLSDFGVARKYEVDKSLSTKAGTYGYMAPEIFFGKKYNFNSDIYSLGIVLYKLLNNGRMPFMPKNGSVLDEENSRAKLLEKNTIPDPENSIPALSKIVKKAMSFNSSDRYQSFKDFGDELLNILVNTNSKTLNIYGIVSKNSINNTIIKNENVNILKLSSLNESKKIEDTLLVDNNKKENKKNTRRTVFKGLYLIFSSIIIISLFIYIYNIIFKKGSTNYLSNKIAYTYDGVSYIDDEGKIWVWGKQNFFGKKEDIVKPRLINTKVNAVSIASGRTFTIALLEDGSVWTWGDNSKNRLGINQEDSKTGLICKVDKLKDIKYITTSKDHAIAVDDDGNVFEWVEDIFKKSFLDDGTISKPKKISISNIETVKTLISNDSKLTVALDKDGYLWAWGTNYNGELAVNKNTKISKDPIKVKGISNVENFWIGNYNVFAVTKSNDVMVWGNNYYGQLGVGHTEDVYEPKKIIGHNKEKVESIVSSDMTILINEDGKTWVAGNKTEYFIKDNNTKSIFVNVQDLKLNSASINTENFILLKKNNRVSVIGKNTSGILGIGDDRKVEKLIELPSLFDVSNIYFGDSLVFVKNIDNQLYGWGKNSDYNIGIGNSEYVKYPVQIKFNNDIDMDN